MAQNYKVYFASRPVFYTHRSEPVPEAGHGIAVIQSTGKTDTMLIENAVGRGAKTIYVQCDDVEKSWNSFRGQFEFVQAAGGFVLNPKHEILFIFRHEKWDLPKGKVEDGESIPEGALREVEEECSIAPLQPLGHLITTWHTYIQKGEPILKSTEWFLMNYAGSKIPEPQAIEGITEVRWLGPDDLAIIRSNTYPSVLDVVDQYLTERKRITTL